MIPKLPGPPHANPEPLPPTFTNSIGMEFVIVPKGKSWLGGDKDKLGDQEVEIPADFYLGKYEVTQEEWEKVMGENPSFWSRTGEGKDAVKDIPDADLKRFPVENVSWDQCQLFVAKLNKLEKETGWVYRLPKRRNGSTPVGAARCRSKLDSGFDFYFAKPTNTLLPEQANFDRGFNRTCKVGSYEPNRLGLFDMHWKRRGVVRRHRGKGRASNRVPPRRLLVRRFPDMPGSVSVRCRRRSRATRSACVWPEFRPALLRPKRRRRPKIPTAVCPRSAVPGRSSGPPRQGGVHEVAWRLFWRVVLAAPTETGWPRPAWTEAGASVPRRSADVNEAARVFQAAAELPLGRVAGGRSRSLALARICFTRISEAVQDGGVVDSSPVSVGESTWPLNRFDATRERYHCPDRPEDGSRGFPHRDSCILVS